RYDGTPLWNVRGVAGVHEVVWALNFLSFYFLYPSTFNILEVAAVDEPKLHMWETGIMRITRHPQMPPTEMLRVAASRGSGLVNLLQAGASRAVSTSSAAQEAYMARIAGSSSIAGLISAVLPADYYKEFLRVPYLAVTAFTLGAYLVHPLMQRGSYYLGW
ncbi:NnrU domain-containing protein, partial [Haematococcus lacustris]